MTRGFFKDDKGRVVVVQPPNAPAIAAGAFWVGSLLPGITGSISQVGAFGASCVWAWLETTQGASPFRRVLGVVVGSALLAVGVMHR